MALPEEQDALERLLATCRPLPVPGLGERAHAAASDRSFARRIAWSDAGDQAVRVVYISIPLLVLAIVLCAASLLGKAREAPASPDPFDAAFHVGFLVQELE